MFRNWKKILSFLVSFSVTFIALDLVFQQSKIISGIQSSLNKNNDFLNRKNYHSFFFNEGFGIQFIDSTGLLTYNPGGKEQINIYGDSYIEGQQVFQRHHFASILALDKNVSIRNFGQSAMNLESMFSRYFNVKEKYPAQKHLFFISDDDFDTDDINNFMCLPEFDDNCNLLKNSVDSRTFGWKQKIEKTFQNSSMLALLKSDLRQLRSPNIGHTIFDKFSPIKPKEKYVYPEIIRSDCVFNLLNVLANENNVIIIYRGKRPLSKQYENLFNKAGISLIDLQKELMKFGDYDRLFYHEVTKTNGHWNRSAHSIIAQILSNEI